MNYVGLFEGISGFGLAFKRAGANILAVCEIDKTCQSVLRRHHPEARVITDVKEIKKESFERGAIDILAGGFPCQDLSVAGLRKGLAGKRSGLWFEFLRIITDHKPRIVVIENVPGLLSSNGGRDFAIILRGLVECGYGVCWRVFDSQYDGVAQRRNRVFIVASLGTASCVEILFERESSQWNSPPSREAREDVAGTLNARASACGGLGTDFECAGGLQAFGLTGNSHYSERPATLRAEGGDCGGGSEFLIASNAEGSTGLPFLTASNLGKTVNNQTPLLVQPQISHTLTSGGADASEDGTGRGTPVVAYNLTFCDANGRRADRPNGGLYVNETEQANTLTNGGQNGTVIAFDARQSDVIQYGDKSGPLDSNGFTIGMQGQFGVRRLTPTECERLQGFPDGWTAFGDDGKPISDSARYRMLGNAVCVPTAEWIAERIFKILISSNKESS